MSSSARSSAGTRSAAPVSRSVTGSKPDRTSGCVAATVAVTAYDHVGIRISNKEKAVCFYSLFGFRVLAEHPQSRSRAVELANDYGVRIHLIANGNEQAGARNILQDNDWGFPGITHVAFVVPSLEQAAQLLRRAAIAITEGPKNDQRRTYLFCRDPDGNVVELNEMK